MKTIKYRLVHTNLEHYPLKSSKLDNDGEVVWKISSGGRTPETVTSDTYSLIRDILRTLSVARSIHKVDDPQRVIGIYLALDAAIERNQNGGSPDIQLGNKSYEWFHSMLGREIPLLRDTENLKDLKELRAEMRELGVIPETFAHMLWRNDCDFIQNQLRDESDPALKISGEES